MMSGKKKLKSLKKSKTEKKTSKQDDFIVLDDDVKVKDQEKTKTKDGKKSKKESKSKKLGVKKVSDEDIEIEVEEEQVIPVSSKKPVEKKRKRDDEDEEYDEEPEDIIILDDEDEKTEKMSKISKRIQSLTEGKENEKHDDKEEEDELVEEEEEVEQPEEEDQEIDLEEVEDEPEEKVEEDGIDIVEEDGIDIVEDDEDIKVSTKKKTEKKRSGEKKEKSLLDKLRMRARKNKLQEGEIVPIKKPKKPQARTYELEGTEEEKRYLEMLSELDLKKFNAFVPTTKKIKSKTELKDKSGTLSEVFEKLVENLAETQEIEITRPVQTELLENQDNPEKLLEIFERIETNKLKTLKPLERKRRIFANEIVLNSEDKDKITELFEQIDKVDKDFSNILYSLPKKYLIEYINDFQSSESNNILEFLENLLLKNEKWAERYDNNVMMKSRDYIIDNISKELYEDKKFPLEVRFEKALKILENTKTKDPKFYLAILTIIKGKQFGKIITEFRSDDSQVYIIPFLMEKIEQDEILKPIYENLKQETKKSISKETKDIIHRITKLYEKKMSSEDRFDKSLEILEPIKKTNPGFYLSILTIIKAEEFQSIITEFMNDDKQTNILQFLLEKIRNDDELKSIYDLLKQEKYLRDKPKTKPLDDERLYGLILSDIKKRSASDDSKITIQIPNSTCSFIDLKKPWIKNYDSTWISQPDGELFNDEYALRMMSVNTLSNGVKKSIDENIIEWNQKDVVGGKHIPSIKYNGKNYYKPNIKFTNLLCNEKIRFAKQEGDITTYFERNNKPVRFKIIHILTNGDVLEQDERLFDNEKEYKLFATKNITSIKNYLLERKLDPKIVTLVVKEHIRFLKAFDNELKELDVDRSDSSLSYIDEIIIDILDSDVITYNDVLRKISELLVFIDNKILGTKSQKFKKSFVNKFYKVDSIKNLSNSDKFPEFYDNTKIEAIDILAFDQQIEYYVNYKIDELITGIIRKISPYTVKFSRTPKDVDLRGKSLLSVSDCENKLDTSFPSYLYITYIDEDDFKTYCIPLDQIGDKNPFTDKPYSQEFLEKISKLDLETIENHVNKILFVSEDEKEENLVEDDRVKHERKSAILELDILGSILEDLDDLESQLLQTENKKKSCEYCNELLKDEERIFKTVVERSDKQYQSVKFCSINCFEKWEPK